LNGERDKSIQAFRHAIEMAKQELAINPRDPQLLKNLADYYVMIGDRANSLKYLDEELKQSRFDKESLFHAAQVYDHLGDTGLTLEWLGKALRAGYSPQIVLQQPDLDNLHSDPRFQELLKSSAVTPNHGK
jgi:tetratricopeptide (TPR) repeat protein